jgi:hypothetical protein
MDSSIIQTIAVYALPVLFAITLHEAAHGYVARMYGDKTAMYAGRITLNPLKHIDPVGTILRLGQAGARDFQQLEQSQERHSICGLCRARREFRDGLDVGTCLEVAVHDGLE